VKDWHPGVPKEYEYLIKGFAYNDIDSLEKQFHLNSYNNASSQVACVIMEPCLFEKPNDGFLQGVRELCTKYGALLIFDEMVTGYRWALAGGQEYFKVTPDLATYGKGMANGLPIGMLCGKREYMQHAELISGTFGGNAVSLAAANAVLDVYESEPVIEAMWKRGEELQHHFNAVAKIIAIDQFAICDGYAVKPRFRFMHRCEQSGEVIVNNQAMSLFLQVTAEHGMLCHPGGMNVCYALTDEDMKKTSHAVSVGLYAVRDALLKNDWSSLKGDIIKPVVTVRS
jgi:glutamate-1-semialdehyde aminotransferase